MRPIRRAGVAPAAIGLAAVGLSFLCFPPTAAGHRPQDGQDGAALSEAHRAWIEEEVAYIVGDAEREAFLSLSGEDVRDAFIEAFWRRRDPNPTTPGNEFRDEHYERIEYANRFYGRDTGRAGWRTDRGRYHIVLGPPRIKEDFSHSDAIYPAELWFYNDAALLERGTPAFFHLLFFRPFGGGEMRLYSPVEDGPGALLAGYQAFLPGDFRRNVEAAYDRLHEISPELASAALSFRTDEGVAFGDVRAFGTVSLVDEIHRSPTYRLDQSYAERFDLGVVESDYLFHYAPSEGFHHVLPGPGGYYVHWAIQMPPESVAVVRDPERGRYGAVFIATIELTGADDPGLVVHEDRAESFFGVAEAQAAALTQPFLFRGAVPVIPGSWDLRVILRNRACPTRDEADCRLSYTLLDGRIDVPEVRFDEPALTEPVIAWRSELVGEDPLYRGYRFGRRRLSPAPAAVFGSGDTLYAMSEPLNAPDGSRVEWTIVPDPDAMPEVPAGTRSEIGAPTGAVGEAEANAGESKPAVPPRPVAEGAVQAQGDRDGPLVISVPLDDLDAGRYLLDIRLTGPDGGRLASMSGRFQTSPRAAVARPLVEGGLAEARPEIAGAHELARAGQYHASGRDEDALRLAEAAVAAGPELVPAREFLAGLLLESGSPARVVDLLAPVFAAHPDRYETARRLGEARVRTGAFEDAVPPLRRALELRAPDADVLVLLATARLVLGDEAEASELLDRALALDPDHGPALALRRDR